MDAAARTLVGRLALPQLGIIELELQLAMTRAELEWVRRLIDEIRNGALDWTPGGLPPGTGGTDQRHGSAAAPPVAKQPDHPPEEGFP